MEPEEAAKQMFECITNGNHRLVGEEANRAWEIVTRHLANATRELIDLTTQAIARTLDNQN